MQQEVKYFFATSSSGVNFFIDQFFKSLEVNKKLAYVIRVQKNPKI